MENRSIITFTIITIGLILIFRLRNKDRQFTKIEVNGKLSNILLFLVAIYGETTIMSMIVCISCEILFVLSMFLMYVLKVDKLFVCFFWGVFQIFFVFIGAGVESLAECKIQEKKGQKIFWFLFGIIMIVAADYLDGITDTRIFGGNIMEQKEFVF